MRKRLKDIGIVIPAYNAEGTILQVMDGLSSLGFDKEGIIVIDDGSSDRTYSLCRDWGAFVVRHFRNMGKGEAQKTGFRICLKKGFSYILTLDADLQHSIEEIPKLLRSRERGDIILGNRMGHIKGMPFLNRISNLLTSLVVSLFIKRRIRDSQCGFRLIRAEVLKDISLKTSHYQTESELLIKAGQKGYRIVEVPITPLYQNSISYINPFWDTLRFILFSLRSLWR